ncbi:hypothetical protein BpHYR1_044175 [Brachionus plicatilis]|uniref:Apolipo L3-like n=1 Tax=Brachionus plicatilis TaxID=10195 RepID=A0A3M7QH91_BRAPC|nr:hypothetical protein BpHYR1_044175 [Brachionus plicatilis]
MEILTEFILKTEEAINILESKKNDIERYHQNSNIARTIGTSVSTAGAGLFVGALLLAPFTGGISIVAASGIGATCGIGGAVVNIGTEVTDHFTSRAFTSQINDIIEERNRIGQQLRENFEYISNISNGFVQEGMNEDDAVANATFLVFQRGITSANLLRIHNINSIVGATSSINFAINSGGQIWRSMRLQSLAMRNVLASLGVNVSRRAAMGFIRNGTIILSAAFVYFDVRSLIESWQNNHPNIAQVEEIIGRLREELVNLIELRRWLIELE